LIDLTGKLLENCGSGLKRLPQFERTLNAMPPAGRPLPWYSSFYWRIALSFVVLVSVVLAGQSVMVSYLARASDAFGPGNPNAAAAVIATDVAAQLGRNPKLDLTAYLHERYGRSPQAAFIVLKDGRVGRNSERELNAVILHQTLGLLNGTTREEVRGQATGPVVSAPIVIASRIEGLVVLPPPPPRGILADVGRLLSLPGTLVLLAATAIAAVVIFAPARRRLRALEEAAERFGAGDLEARAPDHGRDEIARVAGAFNRMAGELTSRTDALQTGDRLRRQMLADISHELRTPLTTMRGYLDTLDMPDLALDDETRRRYLDTVRGETRRLERIVMDLLDLARYENGVAPLEIQVLDVGRVFESVVRRHERDAQQAGLTLRAQVADGADQLTADPVRLEQAVSNLVANAIRHTPHGGTVDLEARRGGGGVELSVADSGRGIAPEHLPHVFDRFYRVDQARAASDGGSGLGLSIVKAIVERHGGAISAASGPGRTAFTMTLPDQ
jgi:two-component system sensor histidine kinase BaeS